MISGYIHYAIKSTKKQAFSAKAILSNRYRYFLSSADRGFLPGIRVDPAAVDLAGFTGEFLTEGLDGLQNLGAAYF